MTQSHHFPYGHVPGGRTIYRPRPFGARAVMLDTLTLENALQAHDFYREHPPLGLVELVPAARTLLLRFASWEASARFLADPPLPQVSGEVRSHGRTVRIPVLYDGQDLAPLAESLGMSEQALIYAHTTGHWSVAFAGFAPGFFYLHRHDNVLDAPRHASPRTSVPAGSVGLAGDFSGIYPRTSPGGWQLIGRTTLPLWDLGQDPPALLQPGMQVQFEAVREVIDLPARPEPAPAPPVGSGLAPCLRVVSPGLLTLFQDAGRQNLASWGLSPSGAADPAAAGEANRLVGNSAGATVLESLASGLVLEATEDCVLALTGAEVEARISSPALAEAEDSKAEGVAPPDLSVTAYRPFALKVGQQLTLGRVERGLRAYLALRGGFAAPDQAQSSSRDTLAGLGPEPLAAGDLLAPAALVGRAVAQPAEPLPLPEPDRVLSLRLLAGPRDDWFTPESLQALTRVVWEVSEASDRIGVRLRPAQGPEGDPVEGPVLVRSQTQELPSEGMVAGAMQVPPNGEPVVFLADHPVTGGYPVVATVHPEDLRLLAQAPPATRLRFSLSSFSDSFSFPLAKELNDDRP